MSRNVGDEIIGSLNQLIAIRKAGIDAAAVFASDTFQNGKLIARRRPPVEPIGYDPVTMTEEPIGTIAVRRATHCGPKWRGPFTITLNPADQSKAEGQDLAGTLKSAGITATIAYADDVPKGSMRMTYADQAGDHEPAHEPDHEPPAVDKNAPANP